MDMISSAIGMKQAQTMSQVQYAVARKVMDNNQMQGDAAVKLIQAAGQSASKAMKAGDQLVAQALGLGKNCDTCA